MILKCAVLFLCLVHTLGFEIGDACKPDGAAEGTCRPLENCLSAYRQAVNFVKPQMCGWKGRTRIVCCPKEVCGGPGIDPIRVIDSQKGKIEGPDMTCRYNGEVPILCCQNEKDGSPPPEPPGCPPLSPPSVTPTDTAFTKCLEYRRYVEPCVQDERQNTKHVRESACGMNSIGDRITADSTAQPKEFPHMALLGCRNEVDPAIAPIQWVAGGSLISDRYILTAGHVLSHNDYGTIRYALLGVTNKTQSRDGRMYTIMDIIPHKFYEKNQKPNDIALLKLDRRVEFSEFIRPACLPSPGLETEPTEWILAGWGLTKPTGGGASEVLMKAYIVELNYETECKPRWPDSVTSIFKKDSMLCAGTLDQGDGAVVADSCRGDSGGPLMAVARDLPCTYVVRGVVSFGPSCGTGPPGIYTNVRNYLPWIIENVWLKQN